MGHTSKHFKSERSANGFANRVGGTVKNVSQGKQERGNYEPHFKVTFETWGQSQIAKNASNDYHETHDYDGYTHTSEDI